MKLETNNYSQHLTGGPDGRQVLRMLGITLYSFVFLGC